MSNLSGGSGGGGGFIDKMMARLSKLRFDDDPYAMFDELVSSNGTLPLPSSSPSSKISQQQNAHNTIMAATDTKRFAQEVNAGAHCPPRFELQRTLDETFGDISAAATQIEHACSSEKVIGARAKSCLDNASVLSAGVTKETAAVEKIAVLNCRAELETKFGDKRPKVAKLPKNWHDNSEAIERGLEKVEEERQYWIGVIADLQKKLPK